MPSQNKLKQKQAERRQRDIQLKIAYYGSALALGGVLVLTYRVRQLGAFISQDLHG